jgi:hypothetical protein
MSVTCKFKFPSEERLEEFHHNVDIAGLSQLDYGCEVYGSFTTEFKAVDSFVLMALVGMAGKGFSLEVGA